jgi:MFS transporter, DHA1 family, multidrug resistance protein
MALPRHRRTTEAMLKAQAPKLPPLARRSAVLRLLIIALLAEMAYAVLNLSTMPVYLKNVRGMGEFMTSVVVTSFLLSEAIFKGPMGHLADRYGCRRFMIFGPLITLCTSVLTYVLPGYSQIGALEPLAIVFMRILDGLGAAMLWPAAFAEMGVAVPQKERQQAMSLLNMCYLLGIALAMPLGGIAEDIMHNLGYQAWQSAGLFVAGTLFAAIVFASTLLIPKTEVHDEAALSEPEGFHIKQLIAAFKAIPTYVLLSVVTFAGVGFPLVIIKTFALEEFKLSPTQFGALVFPAAIGMAVFSAPVSRWGARLGTHRAVHIGLGLCAAGLSFICLGAFFPVLKAGWALALGGIPIGIGFLMAIPAWMTSVTDLDPRRKATNLGAIMTAQGIGAIIGAPLGGLMYEKLVPVGEKLGFGQTFGHYSPFFGCALCVTIGWLISLRALRGAGHIEEEEDDEDGTSTPQVAAG